jgi:SOS-response transcriptional repressor LexA
MSGRNAAPKRSETTKTEDAMRDQEDNEMSRGARAEPLSDAEKRSVLAAFDRAVARAKGATAPVRVTQPAPLPALLANQVEFELFSGIRFYDERVAAGPGCPGEDSVEARPALPSDFFGKQDWGALVAARVSGWSMKDDRIADGDTVLVDTRREAKDGDIVLAHVAGRGQMVKRLRLTEFGGVSLASANSEFPAIVIDDPSSLTIHGVVVGRAGRL